MLTDPSVPGTVDCWPQKAIRDTTILFLGDSGTVIYKPNMKSKDGVDEFLKGTGDGKWNAVKSRWHNLTDVYGCSAGWADWIQGLHTVMNKATKNFILELDPDNVHRLPSWYHVVCFDNLNSLNADTPEGETSRLKHFAQEAQAAYYVRRLHE